MDFFHAKARAATKSCSPLEEGCGVISFSATQILAKVAISRADDVCYVQQ
jgi:hypothetical protein